MTVNVTYATNEEYAPHMMVSIYSMLKNASPDSDFDISIMFKELSEESERKLKLLESWRSGVTIHLIDIGMRDNLVSERTFAYITSETNYRLFLLGELFSSYDRMIYLDCDTVVLGDITELFETDLEGNAAGVVEAIDQRYYSALKKAMFFEGVPYNSDNYRSRILGLRNIKGYFNAGVVLFDLVKARELSDDRNAVQLLNRRRYIYNDQDVLNMIFNEHEKLLDLKWNYTNEIVKLREFQRPEMQRLFADTQMDEYGIIHYVSAKKPWKGEAYLQNYYHDYRRELKKLLEEMQMTV